MDKFDENLRNSKQNIEPMKQINPKSIYNQKVNEAPKRGFNFKFLIAVASLVLVFCVGILIGNVSKQNPNIKLEPEIVDSVKREAAKSSDFSSFESKEEVVNYLNNNYNNVSSRNDYNDAKGDELAAEVEPSSPDFDTPTQSGSSDTSYQTNVREQNVDEADIVKVKGNIICYLSNSILHLFKETNGELKEESRITFKEETQLIKDLDNIKVFHVIREYPKDLYITDKYVILSLSTYEYDMCSIYENGKTKSSNAHHTYNSSYRIYSLDTFKEVKHLITCGDNVSTRLIGDNLYIINNYYRFNDVERYLPYYYDEAQLIEALPSNIYYCPRYGNVTYFVTIYKVILKDEIEVYNKNILTPSVNNIYATKENIYLMRTWNYERERIGEYQYSYPTSIVLVIDSNSLNVVGDFTCKGTIKDQYWIDEKGLFIRTVSTGSLSKTRYLFDDFTFYEASEVFNYLTIFEITEEGIIEKSIIKEGIGKPGEAIRSARFNGDVVTVVTFKNIDPLYYIDISNPEKPVITSSLETTGYSVYQLPFQDNYVIGFGYEVDPTNNRQIGYKISLYDISNKEIKQVGLDIIVKYNYVDDSGKQYYVYTPEFFSNPKCLLVNLGNNMFGFQMIQYVRGSNNRYSYQSIYIVYEVDPTCKTPIKEILREESNFINDNYSYSNSHRTFERMVFIKDNYYLLSYDNVIHYEYNNGTFKKIETINLK